MKEQIPFSKKDSEESSMICPVCRSQLSEEDIHVLGTNEAQIILDSLPIPDFQIPSEIRQFQLTMDKLWVEQHQKGGIINPEENLKRFVVDGSTFISVILIFNLLLFYFIFLSNSVSNLKGTRFK